MNAYFFAPLRDWGHAKAFDMTPVWTGTDEVAKRKVLLKTHGHQVAASAE